MPERFEGWDKIRVEVTISGERNGIKETITELLMTDVDPSLLQFEATPIPRQLNLRILPTPLPNSGLDSPSGMLQ